jgi:putative flippase GtrA
MIPASPYDWLRNKAAEAWHGRALSRKAVIFALIGVVNTAVDYTMFLSARAVFDNAAAAQSAFAAFSDWCRCGSASTLSLIAPNIVSWVVAVTGSYIMNSSITFAAETGRQLRWRDYLTFVVSGVIGLLANTTTLVVAAQLLLLPVWVAKGVAILASFVINFSLSHFVVFRKREAKAGIDGGMDGLGE